MNLPSLSTRSSTSKWDSGDYARVGAFVPARGAAALDLLDPQPGEHILDVGCERAEIDAAVAARFPSNSADYVRLRFTMRKS